MKYSTIICLLALTIACQKKIKKEQEVKLTASEIQTLLINWTTDSAGCLRLRNPEVMKVYAEGYLIGLDSSVLVRKLGAPNWKYGNSKKRHFGYFLDCGNQKGASYNFLFHFEHDKVTSFSIPIFCD